MSTTLNCAPVRKRIKIAEYRVEIEEEVGVTGTAKVGGRSASRIEHYITPLSTGSFRLSIHWQSSSGHPPRRNDGGTRALYRAALFSLSVGISPFRFVTRIAHLCPASLRTDCAQLLINSCQFSPLHDLLIPKLAETETRRTWSYMKNIRKLHERGEFVKIRRELSSKFVLVIYTVSKCNVCTKKKKSFLPFKKRCTANSKLLFDYRHWSD